MILEGPEAREKVEALRFLAGGSPPSRILPRLRRAGYGAAPPRWEAREALLLETQDGRLGRAGLRLGVAPPPSPPRWLLEGPFGESEGTLADAWGGPALDPASAGLPEEAVAAAAGRRLLPLVLLRTRREERALTTPSGAPLRLLWEAVAAASPWASPPSWAPPRNLLSVVAQEPSLEEARLLATYLRDRLGLEPLAQDAASLALQDLGLPEPGAEAPARFALLPSDPLALAARKVVGLQAHRMGANTEGTLRDLDPEFLHDLRVATRRLRSALRLFGPALGPKRSASLRLELGWIGRLLGAVRDLDVFLLNLQDQAARLGEGAAVASLLAQELRRRREPEFEALAAALASRRYAALLRRLRALGDSPAPKRLRGVRNPPADRAGGAMIREANRRVLKAGRKLTPESPPAALHRLRILIKRLRYTAEFFREAYRGPDGSDRLVNVLRELVKFQDCLGEHQDAVVAARRIRDLAEEMAAQGRMPPDVLLELGALIQVQREVARERRGRLEALWSKYDRRAVRSRLARLMPAGAAETSPGQGA